MSAGAILALVAVAATLPFIWRRPVFGLAVYLALDSLRPQDLLLELVPFRLLIVVAVVTAGAAVAKQGARLIPAAWPESLPFAALLASATLSTWAGPAPLASLPELLALLKLVVFACLVIALLRTAKDVRLLLWASVVPLAMHAGYAAWRSIRFGLLEEFQLHLVATGPLGADGGPLSDNNNFARALVAALPIWWVLGRTTDRAAVRGAALAGATATMAGIYLTFSRGGFLAATLALAALAALAPRRLAGWQRALAALLVASIAWAAAPATHRDRVVSLARPESQKSVHGRVEVWSRSVEMAPQRPLLGVGVGGFQSAYAARWTEKRTSHNVLLEVLVELGIVGLVVYLGVLGATLVGLERLRRAPPHLAQASWIRPTALGLEIALLAYMASSLTLSEAFTPSFMLLLALAWAVHRIATPER